MYFFTSEILFSNISNFSSLSTNFSNCLGGCRSFPIASFTVSKNLYGCAVPKAITFDRSSVLLIAPNAVAVCGSITN